MFGRKAPSAAPDAGSAAAAADARRLVLELAGRRPAQRADPIQLGVVIEPGESATRAVPVEVRSLDAGTWSASESCLTVVTDRRVLVRRPSGELVSMWWSTVVGVQDS